jgi:glycosyltransferase involved in cell wall biosynthesis
MYPRISIITPSLNQGSFLETTIESVLSQNYPNLEYIIIDGGSSDNSADIIRKYEKHLAFWVSEKDRGMSHALNKGLKHTTGDIFNWLNSDDYYAEGALFSIAEAFMENQEVQVVSGRERAFYSGSGETEAFYNGTNTEGRLEDLIYEGIIDQPPTFWRHDIVKKLGNLPEELHYTMDSYWWILYLLHFGTANVRKIESLITNFRLHDSSKSIRDQDLFSEERNRMRTALAGSLNFHPCIRDYFSEQSKEANTRLFENKPDISLDLTKRLESVFAEKTYPRYYMQRRYKCARICFRKAGSGSKKSMRHWTYFVKLFLIPGFVLNLLRGKPSA